MTVTPDDVCRMRDAGQGYEIEDGKLVEVVRDTRSSHIGGNICFALRSYARERSTGWVFGAGLGYTCFPDDPNRLRRASASFVPVVRLPHDEFRKPGFCRAVPSVVAEVLSHADLATRIDRKIGEWLSAGVHLVWIVNPERRTVCEYRSDNTSRLLREPADLTGNGVLPGFTLPLAELFWTPVGR